MTTRELAGWKDAVVVVAVVAIAALSTAAVRLPTAVAGELEPDCREAYPTKSEPGNCCECGWDQSQTYHTCEAVQKSTDYAACKAGAPGGGKGWCSDPEAGCITL